MKPATPSKLRRSDLPTAMSEQLSICEVEMNGLYDYSSLTPSQMTFDHHLQHIYAADPSAQYAEYAPFAAAPSPGGLSLYGADDVNGMPSSGLSTASADSSAAGSPQSNPVGMTQDWSGQGQQQQQQMHHNQHPGIVGNDYVSPADFGGAPAYATLDESMAVTFDFGQHQPKGFVGKTVTFLI
ncbi:hypothetical protein GMORB2_1639 [Geosmithia morbida]|uniref:Uncharacterized protein n=1 Tax=Geosmithia morbida TaxID=1094350 RepID=A0A9P4YS75_9HYPO|nr:uncharacterized protein GMORB2_1639 [Geosmithia morbida]KAF4121800.1 hypothetical protein GMORB2_1639 [Geosmithia morbida]